MRDFFPSASLLLDDMGHEAQVVLDQAGFGGFVPGGDPIEAFAFLLGGEGAGEGPGTGDVQGEIEQVAQGGEQREQGKTSSAGTRRI